MANLLQQINLLGAIYRISGSWKDTESSPIIKCFATFDCVDIDGFAEKDVPLGVLRMSKELFGVTYQEHCKTDEYLRTENTDSIDWSMNTGDSPV